MNTTLDIQEWINSTIALWRDKGIKLGKGVSEVRIKEVELILKFQFPISFKLLYQAVNGFNLEDWNEDMFSIWPIERILTEHYNNRDRHFIGISDYLINSYVYGFLTNSPGIYKFYDLPDFNTPEKIADTYEEAIKLINANSNLLY